MACACKVTKHINDIHKHYGENKDTIKTDIRGYIEIFLKKCLIVLICLPLFPLFLIYPDSSAINSDSVLSIFVISSFIDTVYDILLFSH